MKKVFPLCLLLLIWSACAYGQYNQPKGGVNSGTVIGALGYTPLSPSNNLNDVNTPATALGNLGGAAASNPILTAIKLSNTAPLGSDALSGAGNPFVTGSPVTGWTDSNNKWSVASGAAAHATGTADTLTSGTVVVSGQSYLLTYTFTQTSGTGVVVSVGGVSDSARTTTGTYTKYFTATATTAMVFTPQATTAVFSISAVTLRAQGPAITTCGTGPTVQQGSGNIVGYVAVGSGSPTACTVALTGYTNAPAVFAWAVGSTAVSSSASALSNSSFTVKLSATDTGFTYLVIGLNE